MGREYCYWEYYFFGLFWALTCKSEHEALTKCIFSRYTCGTSDHIDTEARGDSAQESESMPNSSMFGREILVLLFVDVDNSPLSQLY